MFFVVEVHGLLVDVGLEGVVGVGKLGQFVGHFVLSSPRFALRAYLTPKAAILNVFSDRDARCPGGAMSEDGGACRMCWWRLLPLGFIAALRWRAGVRRNCGACSTGPSPRVPTASS